jgi:hypothetical protein
VSPELRSGALVALVGLIAVGIAAWFESHAGAQTPDAPIGEPTAAGPYEQCRLFQLDLEKQRDLDTKDRTSEIGKWIGEHEDVGGTLASVDFETSQKPTGYSQGWVFVCMSHAR